MKKFFTLAAAVLASFNLWAGAPTTTLDVEDAVGDNPSVSYDLNANDPKSLTWFGYNSTGSGSQEGFMDKTSRWKLNSSRTASFKIKNCDSISLNAYFTKDATTSVKYAIDNETAVEFLTNGSDKKCEKVGGFKTNTSDEILVTISSSNDLLLGVVIFFPASATTTSPTLNVSTETVTLKATAATPIDSAVVKFTGKNLTPGTYNLSLPSAAAMTYWTITPQQVTVGTDGKLNAEIKIKYEGNDIVESEETSMSLTIDGIQKEVSLKASSNMTKRYLSKSLNIEQLVLDYGTKYDIKSALTAAGWEYDNLDALDTLNDIDNKAARNEPYLGLKMKTKGAYVQGWLKADGILLVKFGNIGCNIDVTVKGATVSQEVTFTKDLLAAQEYELPIYGYSEDVFVTIATTDDKTVVLKQLMLDEIAPVTLPAPSAYLITIGEFEHGKVTATWDNKKYRTPVGATVTLTLEPEEGYITTSLTYNGTQLYDNVVGQPITFVMPAADVTINATFEMPNPTAIKNTEADMKAAKVIRNGQLFIEKSGMLYNAQGAIVK